MLRVNGGRSFLQATDWVNPPQSYMSDLAALGRFGRSWRAAGGRRDGQWTRGPGGERLDRRPASVGDCVIECLRRHQVLPAADTRLEADCRRECGGAP
jgi:hypothetical protein